MRAVRRERQPDNQVDRLVAATSPLLSLFAVVDDVFSEPDAFDAVDVGLGRIYREWKNTRRAFDPEWQNPHGRSSG